MLPLNGITVVSLEHAVAAPFATRQLADLGARVIKIERPEVGDFARSYDNRVDGMCSHFVWINRSKESVALDLKSAAGKEAMQRLVAKADVLIQNLAPGASQRMGLDYQSLRERHPKLIVCDISGYGQDGPQATRKAYDLLIQAEAGFLSVTGSKDDVAKAGCSIADIAAGMYAYSNILAALIERGNTGKGKHIDVSMLEAMAEWMGFPLYYAYNGAAQPERNGASHATIYPYGAFETADGNVIFAIQNEREWENFCRVVMRKPALISDPSFSTAAKRGDNKTELQKHILDVFLQCTSEEILSRLDAANIANANINDMAGLWAHPQLKARERWREVESPIGTLPALLPPGQKDCAMNPIPAIGEHTNAVLEEIGMLDRAGQV